MENQTTKESRKKKYQEINTIASTSKYVVSKTTKYIVHITYKRKLYIYIDTFLPILLVKVFVIIWYDHVFDRAVRCVVN